MSELFAELVGPPQPFLLGGNPETASTLELATDAVVNYSDGTGSDTLPASTNALLPDGTTYTFDRLTYRWLGFTVVGSNVLSVVKEADKGTLTGAFACLCLIDAHGVHPYPGIGSGGGGGSSAFSWATKTADYTITGADSGILVDATGGDVTITLPTAVGITQLFAIKRKDNTFPTHVVLIATTSGQLIDGNSGGDLPTQGQSYVFGSDNSDWYIEAAYYPSPLTTKGDIIVADADALPQRLGVGADGTEVTADSGAPLGVDYT